MVDMYGISFSVSAFARTLGRLLIYCVRRSDNDQYGHINNSIYQHYFDTIINAYLIESCGLEPLTSPTIGLAVATSCQYFRPLSFPQQLELGLRVNTMGRSSVTYEVGIFAADDIEGGPAAVGTFTHVFVDSKSRKSASMSPDLRAGLQKLIVPGGDPMRSKL
jgi:acyl-CoA thioester hydrolase